MASLFYWASNQKQLSVLALKHEHGKRNSSLSKKAVEKRGQNPFIHAIISFGMLEKRDNVPKHIQRWFIFAFYWLMTSGLLFFGSAAVLQIYS